MKVFVAGAMGALGRAAVPALLADGHTVVAATRSPERADAIGRMGARAVLLDLFDASALAAAMDGCEALVRLTARIPPFDRMRSRRTWAETARLRTRGARLLVRMAIAKGCSVYVHESTTLVYGDGGDAWLDEDALTDAGRRPLADAAAGEHEAARFAAGGRRRAVVLRFGSCYASDAAGTRQMARLVREGKLPQFGTAGEYVSPLHLRDAGTAVAAALRASPGVYNVCDDEPVRMHEYLRTLAIACQAAPPRRLPRLLAPVLVGRLPASFMFRSQRVSNRSFKAAASWRPEFPRLTPQTWRTPIA